MEELKATLVSIRYRNPERSWLVANMRLDNKETFLATGEIPYSSTEESLQLYGEWVEDKKYGRQFQVNSAHRILPSDTKGIEQYLISSENIKGIGPNRASRLSDHFGNELLNILNRSDSAQVLSKCPGISIELAERIISGWKRDSSIRKLAIFLGKNNIPPRWATRILQRWNVDTAIDTIKQNPYKLTEIEGIGFITADEMAMSLGFKKDSPERIQAACVYVMSEAVQNGNVFLHEYQLIDAIVKLVTPRGKDEEKVRNHAGEAIALAISNGELIAETISDGISKLQILYLPYLYRAEKGLAERIAELNECNHETPKKLEQVIKEVQENQHVNFSTKQVDGIRGVFSNNILVINGGPGTGKTTCIKSICEVAERLHSRITLAAPTGRAAKRLSEVTNRDATTIHRLLKWRDGSPTLDRNNQLETDILIIDESSMLDLELAYRLFAAIPDGCSIVLIGDVDQLPAVSAGAILRDIISSNSIPVITLDTVFRQAEQSLIVRNAHLIRRGEMPRFPETKGVKEDSYVMWIPANSNKEITGKDDAEWLKEKLARLVSVNIPEKFSVGFKPIDPIRDIQVLVPMKKHTMGTGELNKVLQKTLNPDGHEFVAGSKVFRIGDRVMQMRNNYDEGIEVYNGDIGFILSNEIEEKTLTIDFDGRHVQYPYSETMDLQLAYAQTIHKSQGSEYPIVVVVMGYQHWPMLERNLLYTANTRAQRACIYLASKGAIERAVKNNPVKERNTYLAQRLKAYLQGD